MLLYCCCSPAGDPISMTSPRHHSANALPLAVLSHILQYVPLKQRLGHCALVSTAWAAAAAAATTTIQHRCDRCTVTGRAWMVLRVWTD